MCNQYLNNIQRKAYTCHSERSDSESNPQGNGKAVGIPKYKVDTTTYSRLDYDKQVCRLSVSLPSSTIAHNDRRGLDNLTL